MQKIEFIPIEDSGKNSLEAMPAIKKIPNWFKRIPPLRKLGGDSTADYTVKKCTPVLDAFTTGYYLVTKHDLYWSIDEEGQHVCQCDASLVEGGGKPVTMHPFDQIKDIELSDIYNEYAYKFASPYVIKTPPGYSCIFTHPFNQVSPFYTLTGVVDTDMHPLAVQFPFLMIKGFEGKISAGTPIVQIIPFKREEWKMDDVVPNKIHKKESAIAHSDFDASRYDMSTRTPKGGEYKKKYRVNKKYL